MSVGDIGEKITSPKTNVKNVKILIAFWYIHANIQIIDQILTPILSPNGGPTFGIAMDGEQTHGHTQDATLRVIDELQP